jgi:hypothetical protein
MNASEGRRVDQYLAVQPKPATQSVLQLLKIGFDYLECNGCGRIIETQKLTHKALQEWRFNLMDLKPSILGVARATCLICIELLSQFDRVFRK